MKRHEPWEELTSASLSGDLSDAEREQLDVHLDTCAECRATLAAFADQRRIMAGLRHLPAPRDLGARVRAGIDGGAFAPAPWWRRPAVMAGGLGGGLAAVAGALLALALLNGSPDNAPVGGSGSPAPSISAAASASLATETLAPSAAASQPGPSPTNAPPPAEAPPEPDLYLAYTGPFDNLVLTLRDGRTGETLRELTTPGGPPLAAQLSPNGQFMAYITQLGESGQNEIHLLHLGPEVVLPGLGEIPRVETAIGAWETVALGESVAGSEFLERLEWSPDSRHLAYTRAATDGTGTDVWALPTASGDRRQVTNVGNAYVGSWFAGRGASYLWVSIAGQRPVSYLLDFTDGAEARAAGDPAEDAIFAAQGVFQPLLSPNGSLAIYWRGVMRQAGDEWLFVEGGSPYLAEARASDTTFAFPNERPLFGDVLIDRDAFTSAAIAWGLDSDAYAVWDAEWTGIPQGSRGAYPDVNRVYFGHAGDSRGLTELHAIDAGDIPEGASVVDVKVPTGRHLAITARMPVGGILDAPAADLILVTRNTGDVADELTSLPGGGQLGWFGPAAYDADWGVTAP